MADKRTEERLRKTIALKLLLFIAIVGLGFAVVDVALADWERTSPCSDPSWGWAGLDPVKNRYEFTITKWLPEARYKFIGEIAWDPNMGSTKGEILIRKNDEKAWQKIEKWTNPPGRAKIQVDVTDFIKSNGTYQIEWKYISGRSGICIIKSDIVPSTE